MSLLEMTIDMSTAQAQRIEIAMVLARNMPLWIINTAPSALIVLGFDWRVTTALRTVKL